MVTEIEKELRERIIPFWKSLRDDTYGGYYGLLDQDLTLHKEAIKGSILNSRILWFFSNAYLFTKDTSLLSEAEHGYEFLKKACLDKENGGVYWSVTYDGKPEDTMKHTYNQAFAIYALSAYYQATREKEALELAMELFELIENRCRDNNGYMEAFNRFFEEIDNKALSENGVTAEKTMNTLLHVMEAYTELYRVTGDSTVREKLVEILTIFEEKIFDENLNRLEVFFDKEYNSLIDLHSYGHDIEASWLLDRATEVLSDPELTRRIDKISNRLATEIYERGFDGHSMLNECENGVDNIHRIWWVQAESLVGFVNAYQKTKDKKYLNSANLMWKYIKEFIIDKRVGSEWFWEVDESGTPYEGRPIVEPWKCPYHNGRMCFEVIKRLKGLEEE